MHFAPLQISHLQRFTSFLFRWVARRIITLHAIFQLVRAEHLHPIHSSVCGVCVQYIVPTPSTSRRTLALTAAKSRVAQPRTHLVRRGDGTTLMHSCATRYHNRAQSISLPRPQVPRRRISTRRIFAQSALIDIVPSSTIQ
ncbi:hypothetical protein B0T24DRAFT_160995 [Lasiosphaeria ovina]|uniref:Uncharacterized protein n=1 Tax=Lasiosphaeria ovina TaxID=92902 RepID=A0AAE0KNL4_9PEZI|nr:hypothetical protein B0T24DRAFT_160995 [Lasiosphaeria ovina]